jgi:hypothetical protein
MAEPNPSQHWLQSLPGATGAANIAGLEGLGEALAGIGKLLQALSHGESTGKKKTRRPRRKIGVKAEATDFARYGKAKTLTREKDRDPPTCTNTVTIEWVDVQTLTQSCAGLSGEDIQTLINDQITAAKSAAEKLCTDPNCSKATVDVTYQEWECTAEFDKEDNRVYTFTITLQLELKCRKE